MTRRSRCRRARSSAPSARSPRCRSCRRARAATGRHGHDRDVATVVKEQNPSRRSPASTATRPHDRCHEAAVGEHRRCLQSRDRRPAGLATQLGGPQFTVVFDQAPYIEQSIESLAQEGLLGLLFAVIVILLFLMSVRSTLVTAISIPTSVLITFIGIQAFGYSINILTLGRSRSRSSSRRRLHRRHREHQTPLRRRCRQEDLDPPGGARGRDGRDGLDHHDRRRLPAHRLRGRRHGSALPPVRADRDDRDGRLAPRGPDDRPVLAYWFLKPGKPVLDAEGRPIDPRTRMRRPPVCSAPISPCSDGTLRHSWATLGLAVLVLVGTVAVTPLMKTNFLGDSGQNTVTMTQSLGPAASLDAESAAATKVESALQGIDGVQTVQVSIGSSGSALRDAFSPAAAPVSPTRSRRTPTPIRLRCVRRSGHRSGASRRRYDHDRRLGRRLRLERHRDRCQRARPEHAQERDRRPRRLPRRPSGGRTGERQPLGVAPLHRRLGRPRCGRARGPVGGHCGRNRQRRDAAAARRHGRDRRQEPHDLRRGGGSAHHGRRAQGARHPDGCGDRAPRHARHGPAEPGADLHHHEEGAEDRDDHGHSVDERPVDRGPRPSTPRSATPRSRRAPALRWAVS